MARGKRPDIRLTITGKLGKMGCHRGHHIGEVFDYDTERGKICPMALHCAFPILISCAMEAPCRDNRKERRNFVVPMQM